MDAIRTQGLTKYYGKARGVEDLSMRVPQGAVYGFLGPNGAGKTTTIRCLLGLLRPTSGHAEVLGERVSLDGTELRSRIGYVAGEVRLYERESGRWHLDLVAGLRGRRGPLERELIERLDFDPSRRVRELSKGNRQKLALILGIAHDPELLVLDELTSGLDPLNQEAVFEIIEERVAAGRTAFVSSHILSEVERLCDRVGIIRAGHLVAEEDVHDLLGKRVRQVEVTFDSPVPEGLLDSLEGVDAVALTGRSTVTARAKGSAIDAVVKRIAAHPVTDIRIEPGSLEDVFLEYYREAPGGGPGAPAPADPPAVAGQGGERS